MRTALTALGLATLIATLVAYNVQAETYPLMDALQIPLAAGAFALGCWLDKDFRNG